MPTLDASGYQRLVYGAPAAAPEVAPRAVRDTCWRCHGIDGSGRGPGAFPSLAGQRSAYLHASLRAFADRTRSSGIMTSIAAALSDGAMREIAAYYEALPPRDAVLAGEPSAIDRGEAIATIGIPERDIPACAECHGPSERPKNPSYPQLSGQHLRYLRSQLELLQGRRRGGTGNVNLMHVFVDRPHPDVIRDVTLYYATLAKGTIDVTGN